jgi:hypothetical protein
MKTEHKTLTPLQLIPLKARCVVLMLSLLLSITLVALKPMRAHAKLGVGVQVGSHTGLSAQLEINRRQALNASLSYHLTQGWMMLTLDHRLLTSGRGAPLGFYWGVGALMSMGTSVIENSAWGRADIGARAPFGVELTLRSIPLQFFAELAPSVLLLPNVALGLMGAFGARWRF